MQHFARLRDYRYASKMFHLLYFSGLTNSVLLRNIFSLYIWCIILQLQSLKLEQKLSLVFLLFLLLGLWCGIVGLREILRHGSKRPVPVGDWIFNFFGQFSIAAEKWEEISSENYYLIQMLNNNSNTSSQMHRMKQKGFCMVDNAEAVC